MKKVVIELTEFMNNGDLGPLLLPLEPKLTSVDMRIAISILLKWMKARFRFKGNRPFTLQNESDEIKNNLRLIVSEVAGLSELFVISDKGLCFSEDVSENERDEVLSFVNDQYRPRLSYTRRPKR